MSSPTVVGNILALALKDRLAWIRAPLDTKKKAKGLIDLFCGIQLLTGLQVGSGASLWVGLRVGSWARGISRCPYGSGYPGTALGSLITFINPELGFFKSESDFLIFRVGKSVFRIGKPVFRTRFPNWKRPFSESEKTVFRIRFPSWKIRFPNRETRFPHPFSELENPFSESENPFSAPPIPSLKSFDSESGYAFPSRNSARVEILLSSFTYSLIMTSNLSHFQPQSTTSNGSVSLDPSQKVVLMQLLRQNQHLMQLLVRRQLMQQPMSWTMEMHYPRSSTSDHFWIFDSGCFNHMSPYPAGFITKQPSPHPTVRTTDLTPKPVLFSGNYSTDLIQLPEVLHVPGLAIGLVSLTQLQEMGLLISFDLFGCVIQDPKTKQILGKGRRVGRTLEVVYLRLPLSSSHTNLAAPISTTSSFDLWHARLGHLSSARIKLLANSGVLGNVTSNEVSCLSCKLGKHHALPFELNDYTSVSAFDLIHSDVWGPAPHPSMGGHRYFVIFIDDHTRFTWIYLIKHRSELPQLYINFARMIQTQFSKPIKILRADNAMEYKESSLITFLRSQGTISQYSCPGTSPQNGRAERKHRHIFDTVRTLLVSAKCPERFW
ncbi:hypothetical protein OSB04_un000705 [Centaurea solstitialis]|uniref:Integrase catalytic domain-containing protein n=1 Tax=Centaurea solstitialis TaxID=347529 RepID=A0AA38S5D9_9ASTR|nr:hypothetical protein OSB04_un000705 [Centaurea solstitialis]